MNSATHTHNGSIMFKAEELAVVAFNESMDSEDFEEEVDESGNPIDERADTMNDVAWSSFAFGKLAAMEAWAEELGLEIHETNSSDTSAYVEIALPIEGELDDYYPGVVVRLSDHGRRSRMPGGRLFTQINIAPENGGSWEGGMAEAMNLLFYEALEVADEIEDEDPDKEFALRKIARFRDSVATPYGERARRRGHQIPKLGEV